VAAAAAATCIESQLSFEKKTKEPTKTTRSFN